MKKFRLGIILAATAVLAIGLCGCADESPWGSTTDETGTIEVTLNTDYDFDTARPVFRSGEDETRATADLKDYVTKVPTAADFSIKLEKKDGTLLKDWSSYADFKTYASGNTFPAGLYTITASYGDYDIQGVDRPYFEAKSTFTVLAGQPAEINLTAELKNSMVVVNYTDNFKNYMSEYSSSLRTDGADSKITMVEGKAIFVKPVEADVTVDFTTKLTQKVANLNTGIFAPIAKTLHNITFDVEENDNGATLDITFDESTDGNEKVSIDLTEDLYTTPAPEITCEGFVNGAIVNTNGDAANNATIIMSVTAQGGIQSANLGIKGPASYTQDWGTQKEPGSYEIDLATAGDLSSHGISAEGFTGITEAKPTMATLDLTSFVRALPQGAKYTITLTITDHNDKSNEPISVRINSENITFKISEDPSAENPKIAYNSNEATFTVDYNGEKPREVSFTQVVDGAETPVTIKTISGEGGAQYVSTRAFETKRYTYTVELPENALKSNITLRAKRNDTEKLIDFQIPVNVPSYSISKVDAYATYAYLKVTTPNPSDLPLVMDNIKLQLNGSDYSFTKGTENGYGVLTIKGLNSNETAGTTYSVKSSITKGDIWNDAEFKSFTTEAQLKIPNGDFSQPGQTISQDLQVGGQYDVNMSLTGKHHYYTINSSFSYTLPDQWATINDKTAWKDASNKNTWYIVPSSWLDSGKGYLRNVGYNHNGEQIPASGGYANTKYYCENSPKDEQLKKSAGELFLGEYSFNGVENRKEGISFASRPISISFSYTYTLKKDKPDNGYAYVEILDSSNSTIGYAEPFIIPQGSGDKTITIKYTKFSKQAAKLKVCFKSSNQEIPPIYIPTGSDLDENLRIVGDETISANEYHAVATGSELWIDNVTANY